MNTNFKITFDDIIGYEAAKKELHEVEKYFVDIDKYKDLGARIPKGILLVGRPGNGKTMMVKALANEINIPILSFGDEEEDDEEHIKNLRKIFKEAREKAPCIIFIDEIDKLNKTNFDFTFEEQESTIIRELVTLMDGYQDNQGVVVIATANTTFRLNESIIRSGRFDRVITVDNPTLHERELLFKHYCKNKNIDKSIDFKKLAKRTNGLSCADIDNIINDAALIAIRENVETINFMHIEQAIDRVSFKSANMQSISMEEKEKIAIHEVGHAVVGIALKKYGEVNKISIQSRGEALGHTRFNSEDSEDKTLMSKEDLINHMILSLGGYVSEKIYLHTTYNGCERDLMTVNMIADDIVKTYGMCGLKYLYLNSNYRLNKCMSENIFRSYEKQYNKIINKAYNKTKRILNKNKKLFHDLYVNLLENDVLLKEDIDEIVNKYRK